MKILLLNITLVFLLMIFSCKKNKFSTIPQITVTSISPDTVRHGNIINLKASFTDKEGDADSILIIYKWYNGTIAVKHDTIRNFTLSKIGLPTGTYKGDLNIAFEYNTLNNPQYNISISGSPTDTTGSFGLILIDKQKNRSTLSESKKLRFKKP